MKDKLINVIKNLVATSPLNVLSMWVAWLFVALDEAQREMDELLSDLRRCESARADAVRERDTERLRADTTLDKLSAEYAAHTATLTAFEAASRRADAAEKKLAESGDGDGPSSVQVHHPTAAEVKAWGEKFEAAAVRMPKRATAQPVRLPHCAACDQGASPPRLIKNQDTIHLVCDACFARPWVDVAEDIHAQLSAKDAA